MNPTIENKNKDNSVKFKRIGNGGAFNWKMTNSSFLINCSMMDNGSEKSSYLLFDCGYSVFPKLMELDENGEIDINKLSTIYISHMDGDHIGSLKTLIQYMYFMKNKIVRVVCGEKVFDDLYNHLFEINHVVENFQKVRTEIFQLESIEEKEWFLNNGVMFQAFEVEHYQPAYGLKVFDPKEEINLIISGDTIPTRNILTILKDASMQMNGNPVDNIIFHDYSVWDNPELQVHSCDTALKTTYPPHVIDNLNKYHNNESFLSGWTKLDKDIVSSYKIIKK